MFTNPQPVNYYFDADAIEAINKENRKQTIMAVTAFGAVMAAIGFIWKDEIASAFQNRKKDSDDKLDIPDFFKKD